MGKEHPVSPILTGEAEFPRGGGPCPKPLGESGLSQDEHPGLLMPSTKSVGCTSSHSLPADGQVWSCQGVLARNRIAVAPGGGRGTWERLRPGPCKSSSLPTDHAEAHSEEAARQDSKWSLPGAPHGTGLPRGCPCFVRGALPGCQEPPVPASCAEPPLPPAV